VDENRVKKTESGQDILYINRYFEKNLTPSNTTTHYYLGDTLVAQRTGSGSTWTLSYIHADHLTGTSATSDSSGVRTGFISYEPFGHTRSGDVPTDKKFTGQRLDDTGLYYYRARYYDPLIGRFISPDTIVSRPNDPQSLKRYSYTLNNPLKYTDPSGHDVDPYYYPELYAPFTDPTSSLYGAVPDSYLDTAPYSHDAVLEIQEYLWVGGVSASILTDSTEWLSDETINRYDKVSKTANVIGLLETIITSVCPPPPTYLARADVSARIDVDSTGPGATVFLNVSIDSSIFGVKSSLNARKEEFDMLALFGTQPLPVPKGDRLSMTADLSNIHLREYASGQFTGSVTLPEAYSALSVDIKFAYSGPRSESDFVTLRGDHHTIELK
jgi:RHS repeat-associated protein